MTDIQIQSQSIDDLSIDDLKYHPKIRERLIRLLLQNIGTIHPVDIENLSINRGILESCKPEDLLKVQARVETLRMVLSLPEMILREEREKRAKNDRHQG